MQTNGNNNVCATSPCTLAFSSNIAANDELVVSFSFNGAESVSTVTDTVGTTFTQAAIKTSGTHSIEMWSGLSPNGGPDTVTATFSTNTATVGIYIYELINGFSVRTSASGTGTALTFTTSTSPTYGNGDFLIAGWQNSVAGCGSATAGSGFTLAPTANYLYGSEYQAATSSASTNFPFTTTVCSPVWVILGVDFVPTSSTVTTTVVTTTTTQATVTNALLQVGGIPANSSSVSLVSKTPEMIYVQNPVASAASLVNITLKLAAVDIASATATLYLGMYQQNTPNQVPSAAYPMQLISPTISYNIANGTTGFIHVPISQIQVNGPITICGYCYWGIGIWTNGNHSSGASNSGVFLNQATVANTVGTSYATDALCGVGFGHVGYPWQYLPNQGTSVGLPSNWYFISCSQQKNLAYVAFVSYGVAIVYAGSITQTVTSVSTTTLTTGTTTVTTTANAASQATIQSANFYLATTLIVGLFMVGIWAGGLGGGMLGAIIGEVVAIAAGLFTGGQATLILVSTLIGCAAAFALGQGRSGRGFGL